MCESEEPSLAHNNHMRVSERNNIANSGIVIVDKPAGSTSAFIDKICRKIFSCKKAGHIGTLDPFATGVLSIALGDATKLIPYIKCDKKIYEFEIVFGIKTNTADVTGDIVQESKIIPTKSMLFDCLESFKGEINQFPHSFSAIKINGKKAYELARKNIVPNIKSRIVRIFSIDIAEQMCYNTFKVKAEVSKGTYIRSLAEDIAEKLGTVAFVKSLRRLSDGKFSIDKAISLDKLAEKKYTDNEVFLVPLENILDDIPVVFVSDKDAADIRNGKSIFCGFCADGLVSIFAKSSVDGLFAIGHVEKGVIHPKRIIRTRGDFDVDNC